MRTETSEKVIAVIRELMEQRNGVGFEEYGRTLDDVPDTDYNWLLMAIEEMADGSQYFVKEIKRLNNELVRMAKYELESHRKIRELETENEVLKMSINTLEKVIVSERKNYMNWKGETSMGIQEATKLIKQWAFDRNLATADPNKQMLKLGEEFGELCQGMAKGKRDLIVDSIGDMYVVMTILSMQMNIDIEECVKIAYNEIKDRKGKMINGVFVKESDLNNVDKEANK